VKALRDAVVAGEAPHAGDFLPPGKQGIAELQQWREPATAERGHLAEEAMSQRLLTPISFKEVENGGQH